MMVAFYGPFGFQHVWEVRSMRTRASTFGFIVLLGILVALLVYRSGLVSWADGQNVLADGGFEDGTQPGGPFQPDTSGVMSIPPNRTRYPAGRS